MGLEWNCTVLESKLGRNIQHKWLLIIVGLDMQSGCDLNIIQEDIT